MKILVLQGADLEEDRVRIFENIDDPDAVFVLAGTIPLYEYIEKLRLGDVAAFKLRICRELTGLDVDYTVDGAAAHFTALSDLLAHLRFDGRSYITVNGDTGGDEAVNAAVRTQLSDVVQQLVYLQIPLEKVQVLTEREFQNIERVRRFESGIQALRESVQNAVNGLDGVEFPGEPDGAPGLRERVYASLHTIDTAIEEAQKNEMTITVAASKKSGKSVIVNSMIGEELAPTSLELATPNNCIYRRGESGYTLSYGDSHMRFQAPEEVSGHIQPLFQKAQMDAENGYAIGDMEITYPVGQAGFSSYTIYDTPGPDLAAAVGHKTAAFQAVNLADVIVFAVDYSKFLTETEFAYLDMIKEICQSKGKFYSLIITVNKLDLRYDSAEAKSIPRILDFIRSKLISIAPQFRDCIVMGTSALTYFNCLAAVKISGCECLAAPDGFRDHLEDCIDRYMGQEEMTVLNFLSKMTQNLRNFHRLKLTSIEQLKEFSGMPNFLSYLEYIARGKARTERINNLMHTIDSECAGIQNLFHFQDLAESLANNQAMLERAREILQDFTGQVERIYDPKYPDVCDMVVNQKSCKSLALRKVGDVVPFRFAKLQDYFTRTISDTLSPEAIIDYVAGQSVKAVLVSRLKDLYAGAEITKKIGGEHCKIVQEEDLIRCTAQALEAVNGEAIRCIESRFKELWADLTAEHDCIQADLSAMVNARVQRLRDAIERCQRDLGSECGIPFALEAPTFDFAFKQTDDALGKLRISIDGQELQDQIRRRVERFATKQKVSLSQIEIISWVQKFFIQHIRREESINRVCYDMAYFVEKVYDNYLMQEVGAALKRVGLENCYAGERDALARQFQEFINYLASEMEEQTRRAMQLASDTKAAVDKTGEYEDNIHLLLLRRKTLESIHECVGAFCGLWKDEIMA